MDGSIESINKIIIISLHHYVNKGQTDWTTYFTHVESIFNNSMSTATYQAPNELFYDIIIRLFSSIDLPINTSNRSVVDYLE